jgi:uncharacterized membrane protein YphA (DoxX/SURF4 family)
MSIFSFPRSKSDWFFFIIRLIIGIFFIYASLGKIFDPEGFARAIHNYRLMPPGFINILAIFIPWLELIAGLGMITGFKYRGANLIIFAMLIVFTIAMISAYARGLNINCGCFSTSSTAESDLLARIIEDILLIIGCLLIMLRGKFVGRSSGQAPKLA